MMRGTWRRWRQAGLVGLVVLLGQGAQAQIRVGAQLERRSFVVGESITVRTTMENQFSVPLVLGKEDGNTEMLLEISSSRSSGPPERNRRLVKRDLVIMPREKARGVIEATTLFSYLEPGSYRIRLVLRHEGSTYSSQPYDFDVVNGMEMTSLWHIMSGYDDVEMRYSVRYANREGREEAFFVIERPSTATWFGTHGLGPILRVYRPLIRMVDDGNVVVVHQSGRNRFTRSTFSVDRNGSRFVEQRHFRPNGEPLKEGR